MHRPHLTGDRIAVGAAVLIVVVIAVSGGDAGRAVEGRPVDVVGVALLAVAVGFAALGRFAAATGALGNLALTLVWYRLGYTSPLVHVPYLIAFYELGATGDRRREVGVGAVTIVAIAVAMLTAGQSTTSAVLAIGWTLAALLFGDAVRSRRDLRAEYEARERLAATERERHAERRVAQTRLEIARDLHDVLAHTVSLMTVQAAVGQDALARGDEGAATALETIRTAGKDAMDEVRALVAVLRADTGPAANAPAPRLDRLEELADATRAAGVEVDVDMPEASRRLPEVVALTAVRVVQESLTNVLRHARASTARVSMAVSDDDVVVEVVDDGDGGSTRPSGVGFGLSGMRERVESVGGTLTAGPRAEAGWHVNARIPLERPGPR